ncbi:hypothetical protein [Angustibacter sp. Root456]|uniref:hypothetical protein n=1 Tax=Angustibacter sp. Root456 TaxID=1736539 RepID=UPI0007014F92|nr:hypothetical protein [Angustibacter sp. Root456]KQX61717.1 hypothetical protein ASD06_14095 [Angustibacter sp. Root456]
MLHGRRRAGVAAAAVLALAACASPTGGAAARPSGSTSSAHDAAANGSSAPSPTESPSESRSESPSPSSSPSPTTAQLPRGGTTLFPHYRLVGYAGGAGSAAFGRLGVGDIDARAREIERRAQALAGGRTPLPVFELITVVVHDTPGRNGLYNSRVSDAVIARYLAAARRHRALLLLDIQPGRQDFLPLVKGLARWLEQPDVGLALDPEWAVEPGDVPGQTFGRMTGRELDSVAAYVDALVRRHHLPQKPLVFHQVAASVVVGQSALRERAGVVVIKSVDGIGSRRLKTATWTTLVKHLPAPIHTGFKLFFDEDRRHGPMMTPQQVLALRPQPEYVLYE